MTFVKAESVEGHAAMKQIIAIGGGGFSSSAGNTKLEEYCVQQTQQAHPKVCFLPQASAEAQDYTVKFYENFQKLGAVPSWISLFGRVNPSWQEHLLAQDLIYVGGGNTRSMLALWRAWGMDKLLFEAYQKGIVLCGVSAGAICWFEEGLTDSVVPLVGIQGLSLLQGSCCPHYDSEWERRPEYLRKVKNQEMKSGIALEDYTAAHYIGGKRAYVLSGVDNRRAYAVSPEGEQCIEGIVCL